MQKWWVFSFDLKEESEDECLTERGKVPDHRSDVLKGSPLGSSCPSNEQGISVYLRLSEESERESRDEASQRVTSATTTVT